jgi:hypothetical protein
MAVGMAAGATGISAVAAGATAISAVGRAGAITTRTAAGNGGKRPGLDGPASFPEIHSTPLQKFEAHRYHQPRPEERAFARVSKGGNRPQRVRPSFETRLRRSSG